MTTDSTPLQERIARAICGSRYAGSPVDTDNPQDYRVARLLLPIIAAEVRKAQADAWDEGAYAGYDDGKYDADTPNPYREKEGK